MFEHHKKESPIISLAGVGGGPASYIFYSASGGGGEVKELSRSLRFNGEDTSNPPKLARNGTAGNQRTWTFSTWLKRGTTGSREQIFSAAGTHNTYIEFQDDQLMIEDYGSGVNFKVQLRRHFIDPSAWYHIVVVVDTTISSPASDRVKIYVNGKRETEFQGTPTYPTENYDTSVNDTGEHKLGQFPGNTNFPLKGYLADVHLVDGTAITETNGVIDAFGFFDDYNVWQPKAYSASHGNNGFNLTFSDTSSTAALGYDSAGSNNYTPTNLSAQGVYTASAYRADTGNTNQSWNNSEAANATSPTLDEDKIFWVDLGSTVSTDLIKFDVAISGTDTNANNYFVYYTTDAGQTGGNTYNTFGRSAGGTSGNISMTLTGPPISARYFGIANGNGGTSAQFVYSNVQIFKARQTTSDSRDTPSNLVAQSGNNQGNYATLNPLRNNQTLSNGNLDVVGGSSWQRSVSTLSMGSGRFYWEYQIRASNEHILGVGPLDMQMSGNLGAGSPAGSGFNTETGSVSGTGANGSWSNIGGSTTGDHFGIIFDADAGEMYVFKNGAALNNGNYTHSGLTDGPYEAVFSLNGSSRSGTVNFGQLPYAYPLTQSKLVRNYSSNASYPASNLFDGSTSTYTAAAAFNEAFTWNPYLTGVTSLRIFVDIGSRQEQLTVVGNAGSHTTTFSASTNGWQTIDLTNSGTSIDKITFGPRGGGGQYIDVFAIEVNGTIVTDDNTPVYNSAYGSLCSKNLEATTVGVGSSLFDIDLYDGTGAALSRSNFSFSPEFLWFKQRSQDSTSHALFDVCRGGSKRLQSNERNAEVDVDQYGGGVTSFDDDGFTLGTWSAINANTENYVAWAWEAGGVPTTDNVAAAGQVPTAGSAKINGANMTTALAGTIQITRLTANTLTGLSIITFENPSTQQTLGHALGKKPEMIWVKSRDTGGNSNPWQVYHKGIGNAQKLLWDVPDAMGNTSVWGTTDPTSTLFTLNDNVDDSWIAYVWTGVEGFSSFGSYEGGSGTPYVHCGFQPKWVMVKNADMGGEEWIILDTARDLTNPAGHTLYADHPTYEVDYRTGGNARSVSFLSNGFRVNGGNPLNQSGTHIYAAFAEHPLATARAR